MRRIICLWSVLAMFAGAALAQVNSVPLIKTTSVTSATVPVNILPEGSKQSWCITPRTGAAVPVDCFAYTGTIPGSAPTNMQEITAAKSFCQEVSTLPAPAVNAAWACVLSTGVTAVTVDVTYF